MMWNELGLTAEGKQIWQEADGVSWKALQIVYVVYKNAELNQTKYANLNGMADLLS